jgi:hypothetical protein
VSRITSSADMDHAWIDSRQIAERYVLRSLDPETEQGFEEHLVGCPACQARVEAADGLANGLAHIAPNAAAGGRAAGWPAGLAVAACLLLSAGLAVFFLGRERSAQRELAALREADANAARAAANAAARPAGSASVFMLALPRSGEAAGTPVNEVRLPRAGGWLVLIVERPLDVSAPEIRARLIAVDGRTLVESGLSPAPDGALALAVSPAVAPPGDYRLRLEDARPGRTGALAEYPVRFSPAR